MDVLPARFGSIQQCKFRIKL